MIQKVLEWCAIAVVVLIGIRFLRGLLPGGSTFQGTIPQMNYPGEFYRMASGYVTMAPTLVGPHGYGVHEWRGRGRGRRR
jgi:hypothetical protein